MGGGNGCKSAAKREKNQAKMQKAKKTSQNEALKNAPQRVCKKCFTMFPMTSREPELRTHCENRHPDVGFEQSFPTYAQEMAAMK